MLSIYVFFNLDKQVTNCAWRRTDAVSGRLFLAVSRQRLVTDLKCYRIVHNTYLLTYKTYSTNSNFNTNIQIRANS